jgi:hypothetical protein
METHALRARRIPPFVVVVLACAVMLATGFPRARAQSPPSHATRAIPESDPYVVEYYYKTSWGHADEWLRLFRKNHLPLLKALQAQGNITGLKMEKPRYHVTEDGRWDYRVTITWRSFADSNSPPEEQVLIRKMWPDQETYQREEQRRFEILIAHWDLPVAEVGQEQ